MIFRVADRALHNIPIGTSWVLSSLAAAEAFVGALSKGFAFALEVSLDFIGGHKGSSTFAFAFGPAALPPGESADFARGLV